MPEVKGELEIDYLIMPNTGAMKVSQEFDASDDAKVSDLFRFGMLMQLPYDMDKSQYYGRGPIENYSDREDCMRIGIYSDDADNQYFPYIRPQESGTKGDMRWWNQTDASGFGFKVKSCKPFYASAIHFDTEELDDGDDKDQRHSFNLKKSNSPISSSMQSILVWLVRTLGGHGLWRNIASIMAIRTSLSCSFH